MPASPFAACAMYAFDDRIRDAWRALLAPLPAFLPELDGAKAPLDVIFADNASTFLSPHLVIGHTCGYPLIKRWQSTHLPVSVPLFDIPGCDGIRYRSWLVCHRSDRRQALAAFQGSRAAINGMDSNSGMNVLRHEVAELRNGKSDSRQFFDSVHETGSHAGSLRAVVERRADVAAIDVVSYHHLTRLEPELLDTTRVFSETVATTGLPFVVPRASHTGNPAAIATQFTAALNESFSRAPEATVSPLRLKGFQAVTLPDYRSIAEMERIARLDPSTQLS